MRKNALQLLKKTTILMMCVGIIIALASCDGKPERDEVSMESVSKIYIIQPEIAENLYPSDYNIEMAKAKGLSTTSIYESRFLLVQSGYRAIFNAFLCNHANIDEYQNSLDTSELVFPKGTRTEYSEIGAFGRKNIYIRNSLYVERLSIEDIELILDAIDGESIRINDELLSMVERTWKEIIVVQLDSGDYDEPYEIVYDQDGSNKKLAFNDSLVIELAYNAEFDLSGNILNKESEKAKYQYALNLAEKMETEISNMLSCHVSVIIKG